MLQWMKYWLCIVWLLFVSKAHGIRTTSLKHKDSPRSKKKINKFFEWSKLPCSQLSILNWPHEVLQMEMESGKEQNFKKPNGGKTCQGVGGGRKLVDNEQSVWIHTQCSKVDPSRPTWWRQHLASEKKEDTSYFKVGRWKSLCMLELLPSDCVAVAVCEECQAT